MNLTALDMIVLLLVAGAAVMGLLRGFVTEVLSLFAWIAIVAALKLFHVPLAAAMSHVIGTVSGAAVASFAVTTPYPAISKFVRMIVRKLRSSSITKIV